MSHFSFCLAHLVRCSPRCSFFPDSRHRGVSCAANQLAGFCSNLPAFAMMATEGSKQGSLQRSDPVASTRWPTLQRRLSRAPVWRRARRRCRAVIGHVAPAALRPSSLAALGPRHPAERPCRLRKPPAGPSRHWWGWSSSRRHRPRSPVARRSGVRRLWRFSRPARRSLGRNDRGHRPSVAFRKTCMSNHLGQLEGFALRAMEKGVCIVVAREDFPSGIPGEPAAQLSCDTAQMADGTGAMPDLHVGGRLFA